MYSIGVRSGVAGSSSITIKQWSLSSVARSQPDFHVGLLRYRSRSPTEKFLDRVRLAAKSILENETLFWLETKKFVWSITGGGRLGGADAAGLERNVVGGEGRKLIVGKQE